MALGNLRGIILAPHIVDANEHRYIVGMQVQHIRLPPGGQIPHRIAADAHIDETQMKAGVHCLQKAVCNGHIASADAAVETLAIGPGPVKIGDGIADTDDFASRLK